MRWFLFLRLANDVSCFLQLQSVLVIVYILLSVLLSTSFDSAAIRVSFSISDFGPLT